MAGMPWLSLQGCTCAILIWEWWLGFEQLSMILIGVWFIRSYIESQAALDLASPRRWRSICRTFGTDAITWTAALPFVVAITNRIQTLRTPNRADDLVYRYFTA